MAKEIAEEYASSLSDLTMNSKPLINMLTILAEENVEHAGVIVETVEKHLEKVQPEIKLPVLYLVDSIIKNVGGAYMQKFSQTIVNMFTRTFKQVDEKTRSQMFKLRDTWHEVFPATKLYQLDVKVNLIDPAWPIQAQPQQSNIHVNPNFLKKPLATPSAPKPTEDHMKSILAKKEQELLMLQRKKIEMELEQAKKQLEIAENSTKKPIVNTVPPMPSALVNPVVTPTLPISEVAPVSAKLRLGPPVNNITKSPTARIAPVSGALVAASRRDPRLARHQNNNSAPIAPNVFDIKPLERVTKRKNVITIDVTPDLVEQPPREQRPRRDPRLERKQDRDRRRDNAKQKNDKAKKRDDDKTKIDDAPKEQINTNNDKTNEAKSNVDEYLHKLQVADPKRINKLPPIPKISKDKDDKQKDDTFASPTKRRKEVKNDKEKKKDTNSPSPKKVTEEKKNKNRKKKSPKSQKQAEPIAFKELKNFNKEKYMRRNREQSESPEKIPENEDGSSIIPATSAADVLVENKDVDLRVLQPIVPEAKPPQKRSSTDTTETKSKKTKLEKFDILFGNEDVDLRKLPQVNDVPIAEKGSDPEEMEEDEKEEPVVPFTPTSPKKDWNEVKEKETTKKTPSKLELVRAKLAEATKGKDRLGRPLLFSGEKERRRTISSEDTDLRPETEDEVNQETISLILSQAKEHFKDGKMDKNQYNTLMFQIMQLNEKLKLKEAKQRESLELSKRKLHKVIDEPKKEVESPKSSPKEQNRFGDIDERVAPPFVEPAVKQEMPMQDSDMRIPPMPFDAAVERGFTSIPSLPRMLAPFPGPIWRGSRHIKDEYRPRLPVHHQNMPRPNHDLPPAPKFLPRIIPKMGICQPENPVPPYRPNGIPPPLGAPGIIIPPTSLRILDYIDLDPMKTIDIDGIPREIRFYGEIAVIMLDWDDPREITFLPGSRRINFDNKDSVVLNFNDNYQQVEIEDQVFDIRYGSPTRELYINGKWYEVFFGTAPVPIVIEGHTRVIQLEGPPPQVDIAKERRLDLCAGKINLIIDAQQICPVFLDAKIQKFVVDGKFYTIRFADSLKTVLINEQPFQVEFGGLPRPIFLGKTKHFIRFSVLPKMVKPGFIRIIAMEGEIPLEPPMGMPVLPPVPVVTKMEVDEDVKRPEKILSPENNSSQGGLDVLASLMPSTMAPASSFSGYSMKDAPTGIPGLEAKEEPAQQPAVPLLGNLNVNDLFAKLVATGIVHVNDKKEEPKEIKSKPKEDKTKVHKVDLLRPETLRVKQPAIVSKLYGGMQCSGCGTRFPPEHTVKYSQHLDWHFRQNRKDRDSARRAHSRHWHYDLPDWVQYEEIEDLEDREKSWFENVPPSSSPTRPPSPSIPPSVKALSPLESVCALCGDKFDQFYNEDQEEWHLRLALRHNEQNYHPLCFEEFKASQAKEQEPDESVVEIETDGQKQELIEVSEDKQETEDDESDVELVEADKNEPIEIINETILDDEEDDVVLKSDPIEQVDVEDADTDDETQDKRKERDREFDFSKVKVKQEPVDPDDEPVITAEEEVVRAKPDNSHMAVESSIDGNIQFESAPQPTIYQTGSIRFNITKTIPVVEKPTQEEKTDEVIEEPPPPGEEKEIEYELKESMKEIEFSRQPPLQKGTELSGLCSIM